ncbi:corepressor interacting with RBPJ 1 [Copidosoma floridanum]|uniref:corepressor interacting with RBPJ 1 n=1 Tax=Copidosoma floridanum TaxID=29053 RepID=UPI000C6F5149|nr:corepressor interacting with RBPJ 1 [Copidosoma floridanum]
MGKGFNNYMCKKFFHPASRDNLKRVWMAEQQAEAYKKKQEELRMQYEKEQDLHNNKALLSKESKDKLSVNFMYEPPPGAKKEREKEDNEPEYKFEWQRKYNAPRESYCKGDSEIRDQPFGIQVRNVRCIKCHKWGHINTDKECPLYSQAMSSVLANNNPTEDLPPAPDAFALVQQMRDDGLALKKSALNAQQHLNVPQSQELMVSEDEETPEAIFLKSLSKKEKKKLLKKLEKLEEKKLKKKMKMKKSLKKKKNTSKSRSSDSSRDSSSDSSSIDSSSDSSSSSSSSEEEKKKERKRYYNLEKESKSYSKSRGEHRSQNERKDEKENYGCRLDLKLSKQKSEQYKKNKDHSSSSQEKNRKRKSSESNDEEKYKNRDEKRRRR